MAKLSLRMKFLCGISIFKYVYIHSTCMCVHACVSVYVYTCVRTHVGGCKHNILPGTFIRKH